MHVLFDRRSSGREDKCKRDNCGPGQHSFRTSIASKAEARPPLMVLSDRMSPSASGQTSGDKYADWQRRTRASILLLVPDHLDWAELTAGGDNVAVVGIFCAVCDPK